eukprot:scaffold11814_cov107-Skeletonema_marinoi.AAC.2
MERRGGALLRVGASAGAWMETRFLDPLVDMVDDDLLPFIHSFPFIKAIVRYQLEFQGTKMAQFKISAAPSPTMTKEEQLTHHQPTLTTLLATVPSITMMNNASSNRGSNLNDMQRNNDAILILRRKKVWSVCPPSVKT